MEKIRVFESFSGYGSQTIALAALGVPYEVVGTSDIEPNAIIAYAAMRNRLHKNEATKEEMLALLESRNIGWDFQKNKSTLRSMKADKLQMLYDAVVNCNNLGDISLINPNDMPNADMFTYSSPCFTGDTLVLTENGYVPIKDITVGTKVVTHTGELKEVVNFFNNGEKDIYKLSGMCFDEIRTTYNHKFYIKKRTTKYKSATDINGINHGRAYYEFTEPQWVEYKDLQIGDYLGIPVNTNSIIPTWGGFSTTWDRPNPKLTDGRMITNHYHTNHLNQHMENKDFWWLIGRYLGDGWLNSSGGIKICCAKHEKEEIEPIIQRLGFNYYCAEEKTVLKFQIPMKEIGLFCAQFGSGASNKHLTSTVLDLPIDLLQSFIEGYISADGTREKNKKYPNAPDIMRYSSVSKQLVYDLSQCIFKLYHNGCSLYKHVVEPTRIIEGRTVNQKDYYGVQYREQHSKQQQSYYQDGYIWYPIRNLEKCAYQETVYDIEVADNHSFIANNAIVHNCQSFSLAGKNEGGEWICEDCEEKFNPIMNSFLEICPKCGSLRIKKPTSSLLWECVKIINAKHYPILMMENVKNIVGEKNKPVFDKWCEYLESQGYENHWTILNAKELNVPQNRERMIMISVHKASHWHSDLDFHNFKFPEKMELEYCIRDAMQPEEEVADKFYLAEEIINRFQEQYVGDNVVGTTKTRPDAIGQRALVYNPEKIIGTLTATDYKQAKSVLLHIGDCEYEVLNVKDKDSLEKILASTPCVVAQRGRLNAEGKYDQCYEPNTTGATNTLTTALKDNYILNESNKSQDIIYVGSLKLLGMLPYCKMHDQCGRIYGTNGVAPTITTMTGGHQEPKIMCCVYSDDEQKLIIRYFTIRKLTPIECGRLMGVPNPFIQRCVDVGLKDSHLYHMFGNSIVTTMLMGVFGELFNVDNYDQKICNLTASIYKKKV